LVAHVHALARVYEVSVSTDQAWVQIANFVLPVGFNAKTTPLLVGLPPDYPLRPPGVLPHGIFVRPGLRFRGGHHSNIVEGHGPGWDQWSWLCVYRINWDPRRDDLLRLLELARTVLSGAPT
jgi:hypothetical protein